MPFGPFAVQWRTPSPNPPNPTPLPAGISRSYITTPSGPLELLTALPSPSSSSTTESQKPPLFFAHGGYGCASIWTSYMLYFSARGYPCYAISYRGHGGSWYPGFWQMYFTSRTLIGQDLVAGIEEVGKLEAQRRGRKAGEGEKVVLVAHSAGGALSQFVLSRGMCEVGGFCLLAGVPGFGSWSCYFHWLPTAMLHFYYRAFHSKYLLATTSQVRAAFFTRSTPTPVVKDLERLLAPYESMAWPMQALSPFVTGPDVLTRITGWTPRKPASSSVDGSSKPAGIAPRMLVLAAEHDVLCTPRILQDAAVRYRRAFHAAVRDGLLEGASEKDFRTESAEKERSGRWDGVAFTVVPGVAHHLQNHVEWEKGAERVLEWVEEL